MRNNITFKRSSGIILHPTSLPAPDGIGDLGPSAYHWLDTLAQTGCSLWQVLPLGPTGYGDSPYQCFSAFAGNPYLVSSELLLEEGLLSPTDLLDRPIFPLDRVDFGRVIPWKLEILQRAFHNYKNRASAKTKQAFKTFQETQSEWLDEYAVFMAIKQTQSYVAWNHWPQPLRQREEKALAEFEKRHRETILQHKFFQFLFFKQWIELKEYAHQKGIQIIGDIPIFVAHDSADVWACPQMFYLKANGSPSVVAGVPPDYFSPTGQLWGNPLYRWNLHKKNGFSWWIARIRAMLQLVDIIRLDHFRGFAAYWQVPANRPTAEYGKWVKGPGASLFVAIKNALGEIPIIAEDLGFITPDVVRLREQFNFPGMKILQFAFSDGPQNRFLPHNYPENCVVYTGTHDNDTVQGWYASAPEKERDFCRRYLARSGEDISWDLIRAAWSSVAIMALAPMQDVLNLGNEARMNYPSRPMGNWTWRMLPDAFTPEITQRLSETNYLYKRSSQVVEEDEHLLTEKELYEQLYQH
ncbi:MAG: 4-alpha-glucanotransferase [Anaerolineae bacterium]|nr:4-alpha-glucanotransferase [Anaerolineae bacterium]